MAVETDYFQNPAIRSVFVLGGAASGKEALAERIAAAAGCGVTRLDLAGAPDPLAAIARADAPGAVLLIGGLTEWIGAVLRAGADAEAAAERLAARLTEIRGRAAVVSEEVGLGIVPATPEARALRDAVGRLNQRLAAASDVVLLAAAGLARALKAPA
jgi:adenosylcobinamide kinase/adenosylcobinamide-phosphate guanylyltransferase